MTGSATITINGITRTQPLNFTQAINPPARLTIFAATCDTVSGDFTIEYQAMAEARGLQATGSGSFVAFRVAEPSALLDSISPLGVEVATLQHPMQAQVAQAQSGRVNVAAIMALIVQAESLTTTIEEAASCRERAPWYAHLLAPQIFALLQAVLASPDGVPTDVLVRLASLGYRTGAMGGAATDEGSARVESDLERTLYGRLDAAVDEGNADEIAAIGVAAAQFGWDALATEAFDWIREGG
jgi:hypothetical protein